MIRVVVKPGEVLTWVEFCKKSPPYSIALDGYVFGAPAFQDVKSGGPRVNFNHHEGVDRMATRCTAAQVHYAVKLELFKCFSKDGYPHAEIYVNDCDQDVSSAIWLLRNHERIRGVRSEPLINRLVTLCDRFDVTGGSYPMNPEDKSLRQYDWVFEPYTAVRMAGRLPQMGAAEQLAVIDSICARIDKYSVGEADELPPDIRYEIIGGGADWKMVREQGSRARLKIAKDGITAFVSVLNQRQDGKWTYTLARQSVYIPFPLPQIYQALNLHEGRCATEGAGGGDTIGGSSRKFGCSLSPPELEAFINKFLSQ